MKKKIILLMLLVFPFKVSALTGSTNILCAKNEFNPGESVTCYIEGTVSDDTVSGVDGVLSVSDNLTIESVTPASGWQGDSGSNIKYYTSNNKTGTFKIASFNVKASSSLTTGDDTSITFDSVEFTGSDFQSSSVSGKSVDIRIYSTINTLSNITLSDGNLNPEFNVDTLNYAISTEKSSITIEAITTNNNSTVSGDIGEKSLVYGNNPLKINVSSESGVTKTYNVNVFRIDTRDTENSLNTLSLNNSDIELVDGVLNYDLEVENNIKELEIIADLKSDKSSFVENFGPRTVNLSEGKNSIEIRIKAENEVVQTYILNVTRKQNSEKNGEISKSKDNDFTSNPKTGSLSLYIVFGCLIVCIVIFMVFYFKRNGVKKDE